MSINDFLVETAWRFRAYLGSSADARYATDEEAILALIQAEHCAAQHQLPAPSVRCVYRAPWGCQCQAVAITPQLYGFLTTNRDTHQMPEYLECWPFSGRLCAHHLARLVIPPPSWWPAEAAAEEQEVVLL